MISSAFLELRILKLPLSSVSDSGGLIFNSDDVSDISDYIEIMINMMTFPIIALPSVFWQYLRNEVVIVAFVQTAYYAPLKFAAGQQV